MHQFAHGYTNDVVGDAKSVVKTYLGPDAELRRDRELTALARLRGHVPLPPVLETAPGSITLGFVEGVHGQELVEAGRAPEVMGACGEVLRRLHDVDPGELIVHGDFGPNNVLIDPSTFAVTAVLDWEFTHVGDPLEDLAWCEWIMRAHHPDHIDSLPTLYRAYGGPVPPWPHRQAIMPVSCRRYLDFCERWDPDGVGVRTWTERAADVETWQEVL